MRAIFINGSPRKNKNTAQMLEAAMKGAQEAGADVEMIHLYGLNYKGCMSCFLCKRKGNTANGLCGFKDELQPVLEKVINADVLVSVRLSMIRSRQAWHVLSLSGWSSLQSITTTTPNRSSASRSNARPSTR